MTFESWLKLMEDNHNKYFKYSELPNYAMQRIGHKAGLSLMAMLACKEPCFAGIHREVKEMFDFFKKRREEQFRQHKTAAEEAYGQQKRSVAIQELELALKAKPSCFETWCQYGDWSDALASEYMLQENMEMFSMLREQAERAIKKSLEINPDYALGHYRLANIYWGTDFRKALVEFEKAAELDTQYSSDVERTKSVIKDCTHRLKDLKVYHLNSLRAEPLPQVYEQEFYFENTPIGSVVMYTSVFGSERQWTHSWLFRSEEPNLFEEAPIGEVVISSTGHADVSPGCPGNYGAVLQQLQKEDLLEQSSVANHSK